MIPRHFLATVSAMALAAGGGEPLPAYDSPLIPAITHYDTAFGSAVKGVWALRKAVSTYAGPLVRIRDTNDNVEQDVGFDVNGDLAAFSPAVVGNAAVVTLYDQSGNGAHLVQATTTRQPFLLRTASPQGKPAIKFDGSDDYLADGTSGTTRPYMVANLQFIVGIGAASSSSGTRWIASIPQSSAAHTGPFYRAGIVGSGATFLALKNGTGVKGFTNSIHTTTSGWGIYHYDVSADLLYFHASGGEIYDFAVPGSVTYPASTGMRIGANGGGGEAWGGHVFELAAIDGSQAVEARAGMLLGVSDYFINPAKGNAHRHWGIYSGRRQGSNNTSYSEAELVEIIGGSDETGFGTASATSVFGSNPASNAFDDNETSVWASNGTDPARLMYDFGDGNAKKIRELKIRSRDDSSHFAEAPVGGGLMFSDDGTNWYTEWVFDVTVPWVQNELKAFGVGSIDDYDPASEVSALNMYTIMRLNGAAVATINMYTILKEVP